MSDEKKECKLVGDSFAAQTENLRMSVPKSVDAHKNPIVKPIGSANSSIKPA